MAKTKKGSVVKMTPKVRPGKPAGKPAGKKAAKAGRVAPKKPTGAVGWDLNGKPLPHGQVKVKDKKSPGGYKVTKGSKGRSN